MLLPLLPLVGRAAELGQIALALDAAAGGSARAVALAGEGGVGKSRLAEECIELARERGFSTLHAVASPLHADLHYGVIVDALRPLMRTVELGERTSLVEGLADLVRLFGGPSLPAPLPLGDAGMERIRLYEALCRLVDRLTRQQPVLFVVDDLHWADPASLAVLEYVIRGLADRPFLLLCTHRAGESRDDVDSLLSSLRRSNLLVELDIGVLDEASVVALARELLAGDPSSTLIDFLIERTRGLPLFVRALVTMLVDSGRLFRSGGRWVLGPQAVDGIPPQVTGLLRARLDALDPAERTLIESIAVAGGAVSHDLISRLCPGEEKLLQSVDRLCAAGLVEEEIADLGVRYRVTHPLLAEVAYGQLPLVVRRRRHAAIASALERVAPDEVGRLAHHIRGAGDEIDAHRAFDVLDAALQEALQNKAGEEAAGHAEGAIVLARRLDREDVMPRLQEQRAEALEMAGRGEASIAAWREAAHSSAVQGRPVDAARQLRRLALVEWDAGHLADSQTHLDAATTALSGVPAGPEHLAVAAARMHLLTRRGLVGELRAEVDALDRIASATGSTHALAWAHLARADLSLRSGDHRGAERATSLVMRLAREEDSVLLLEEAHRPAFCNEVAWGDHAAARRLAEEGFQLTRETGVPALEIIYRLFLAFVDFLTGAWDGATTGADDLLALTHRIGMRRGTAGALCVRGLVHARRGQFTEAGACVREARSVFAEGFPDDRHVLGLGDVCEALVLLGRSRALSALQVARSINVGGIAVPPLCLSVLGEAQVAAGDFSGARETAQLLIGLGPRGPYPVAVSSWLHGLLARAANQHEAATAAFTRAADRFAGLTMPYEAAVARLDWAEIIAEREQSHDDRAHAQALVADHLAALDGMGARPVADRARRLLRRLGARPVPAPRVRPPGQLSARETEIALLVAEGLSNPEIADRLFISQRTVTTHLQHIYHRLGISSRTGLTRYAIEQLSPTR